MKPLTIACIPALIGLTVGLSLYFSIGWWGFLVLFPWIGSAIALGIYLRMKSRKKKRKALGRRISILLILPALLIFVPFLNNENFQLEGVALIVLAGFYSKGFIHYCVAKLFGPLIWGRGFCGWACWTAAVLDWLPVKRKRGTIPGRLKSLRYAALAVSLALPLYLVLVVKYDVHADYIGKAELSWMMVSSGLYYLLAVPMAFWFRDRRAFCKVLCPVSLVMKVPARFARIRKRPTSERCIECGICTAACPMDVDVMSYVSKGEKVTDTECILCSTCSIYCPSGAVR